MIPMDETGNLRMDGELRWRQCRVCGQWVRAAYDMVLLIVDGEPTRDKATILNWVREGYGFARASDDGNYAWLAGRTDLARSLKGMETLVAGPETRWWRLHPHSTLKRPDPSKRKPPKPKPEGQLTMDEEPPF